MEVNRRLIMFPWIPAKIEQAEHEQGHTTL